LAVTNFGVCGVGACGFWRYRMPPISSRPQIDFATYKYNTFFEKSNLKRMWWKILIYSPKDKYHLKHLNSTKAKIELF